MRLISNVLKQNSKPDLFQEFQPKIKKDAEQFPSPQNKLKQPKIQPKTNKKKLNSSSPNKKTHLKCYPPPPGNFRIRKNLKKTRLARCLGSSQGLSLLKRWDWKTKTSGILGTAQGWLVVLPVEKTSPFPGGFPRLLRRSSPVVFYWGVLEENHASHIPKWVIYGMEKRHSVKITLKSWRIQIQKTECRMNFPILREHIEYFINHVKSQHFLNGKLTFFQLLLPFFWGIY